MYDLKDQKSWYHAMKADEWEENGVKDTVGPESESIFKNAPGTDKAVISADTAVVEWESQFGGCVSNSPLAPGRPTNGGGTPISCAKLSSPCVPVGWAGCTLLGGLESMLIRIVFGSDGVAVVWKSSHDRPGTWCDRPNRSQ